MLSSCARFATRKTAGVAAKAPSNRPSKISTSLPASNSANKSLYASKRFYAGHHHHEEAPKPYKRTTLAARPSDSLNSSEEREREVQGLEGWIFGRKVTYIDPLKPIPDTEAQAKANGWMWNKRVRFLFNTCFYTRSSCLFHIMAAPTSAISTFYPTCRLNSAPKS